MSRGNAHRGGRKKHALPRDQRRPAKEQPKYGFWRSVAEILLAPEYLLIALAVVAISAVFYLVLPPDGRLTFAALLGIVGGAVGYRVVRAVGWWRGSSAPTGEERGLFDWWNINLADEASRRGAVVEAIFGVCVYVVMVLAFVISDTEQAERAIYLALVGVGISVVLWISTAAFGLPRFLLPSSFRHPPAQRRRTVDPSQRPPSRPAKKRRVSSRKGAR